jgi:branched-chain amino acid transport system ATP-binding protein
MQESLLQTSGLTLKYGDYAAVSEVDLSIRPRQLHSIIGPNGAGKTSLFHLLSGTREATGGKVLFEGTDVTRLQPHQRLQRGLARSFQITELFWGASVHENVRLAVQATNRRASRAILRPASHWHEFAAEADRILERLGLSHLASSEVGKLSHGQQRLVEIAVCLAGRPKLILLDEPTSGMGVDDIPRMMALVRDLTRDYTVVLIEHNMGIVMKLSDEITVLAQGRVLARGTPADISADPKVRGAYLGS